MILDLLNETWVISKNTETSGSSGEYIDNYITDTDIGDSGNIKVHFRNLSLQEIKRFAKKNVIINARIYTNSLGITAQHMATDENGNKFNVVAVNNPHDLGEFYQIDLLNRLAALVTDQDEYLITDQGEYLITDDGDRLAV